MDIAVNLVENYLRLNGYLTLSEFEVQRRVSHGHYKTVTDVDIMAWAIGTEEVPERYQGPMMDAMRKLDFIEIRK